MRRKLSEKDQIKICKEYLSTRIGIRKPAERYGVTHTTISRVILKVAKEHGVFIKNLSKLIEDKAMTLKMRLKENR